MKRKILSVILAALLAFSLLTPAFAVSYPDGVTEETAAQSAENLDKLIRNLLPLMDEDNKNRSLADIVNDLVITDETLSGILTSLYGAMDEYASALSVLGIDVSPAAISAHLSDYPEVSKAISAVSSFSELDLSGVKWGVKTRGGFARAISLMLSPFNDVLYMLLCSGNVNVSVVPIFGDDGYVNGIIPMLNALGFFETMSNDSFKARAAEWKGYMIEELVLMIFELLDDILASPVTELCARLPNLAFFFKSGGFSDAVDALLHPISLHIGDIITLVPATKLISILMFFSDTKKYTTNFTENMTTILNDALESSDLELAEIDLDALQSCGTESGGRIEANIGEAFAEIMTWLLDTVKLNKESIPSLLEENDIDVSDYLDIINGVLEKPTNDLLAFIVKLMTAESGEEYDYQWVQAEFVPAAVDYGTDTDEYEMGRMADGIDETIEAFIKEGGQFKNLKSAVKESVFSNNVIAMLTTGLYSLLGSEELSEIIGTLGFDFSPSAVGNLLSERQFAPARRELSNAGKWENVQAEKLDFGIKKGSSSDFEKALVAVLRPFAPLIRTLLANDAIVILDSVHIGGSNGYNTAIIPLLEALGCKGKDILTYKQYVKKADSDGAIKGIVHPIVKLIDGAAKKPISTVIDILPNALYFISNGSLMQCLINLLHPVLTLLDEIGMKLDDMGLNLDELKETDLLDMISDAVPTLTDKVKLPKPDLKKLANLGTAETRTSKATYQGSNYDYSYIKADRPGVMLTIMRYVVGLLEMEENADLIGSFMSGGAGGSGSSNGSGGNGSSSGGDDGGMFAEYSEGFADQMKEKTVDENIAWLYRLFFHERIVEETTVESYTPHIIYEEKEKHEINVTALVAVIFVLLVVGTLALVNRKRISYTFEMMKRRRKEKKEQNREVK